MSVYKKRTCSEKGCTFEASDSTQLKVLPACGKCGADTRYSKGWYAVFRVMGPDGVMVKHKKVKDSKAEAVAYENEMLTKREKGDIVDKSKDTSFAHAAKVFFDFLDEQVKKGKLAQGSSDPYKYNTQLHLIPFFGSQDIKTIEWEDVEFFIEAMEEKPMTHAKTHKVMEGRSYSPATINRCLAALKRIMAVAIQKRLIKTNQLSGFALLNEDNENDRYLSHKEIETLLKVCAAPRAGVYKKGVKGASVIPHLRLAVVIGLNTGLRIDGVLTLKWSEIDWRRNEIVKVVKHRRSSGPKTVHIPMNSLLREALVQWKKDTGVRDIPVPTGYVIPSPVNSDEHMLVGSDFGFTKACRDAGIEDFTFHQLRHTFCTHFLEQYPDKIEVLQRIVGHSSSYMTRRYAHITDRAKHQAMEGFSLGGPIEASEMSQQII